MKVGEGLAEKARGEGGWEPQMHGKEAGTFCQRERQGSRGRALALRFGFQDRPGCWLEGHPEGMGLEAAWPAREWSHPRRDVET